MKTKIIKRLIKLIFGIDSDKEDKTPSTAVLKNRFSEYTQNCRGCGSQPIITGIHLPRYRKGVYIADSIHCPNCENSHIYHIDPEYSSSTCVAGRVYSLVCTWNDIQLKFIEAKQCTCGANCNIHFI